MLAPDKHCTYTLRYVGVLNSQNTMKECEITHQDTTMNKKSDDLQIQDDQEGGMWKPKDGNTANNKKRAGDLAKYHHSVGVIGTFHRE